jgi:hypothetical protein
MRNLFFVAMGREDPALALLNRSDGKASGIQQVKLIWLIGRWAHLEAWSQDIADPLDSGHR